MNEDRHYGRPVNKQTDMHPEKYAGKHTNKYADIIELSHPISVTHPQMPLQDRAAQFSPFAALTGYEEAIEETARLTAERPELDEGNREILDERLRNIRESLKEQTPTATVTYFVPDEKKSGGAYRTVTGIVKKLREYEQEIVLADETVIPLENLIAIEGDRF